MTADAIADGQRVSGGRTKARLNLLLTEGFTKTELARRLGSKAKVPALQIARANGKVLARTALRVERLYKTIMAGA